MAKRLVTLALTMLVTAMTWADTSTLFYKTVAGTETGATAWSSSDATEWSGSTFVEGSGLKVTDASTVTANKTISYTPSSILTYTALWQIDGGTSNGSNGNYVYLKLGNSLQISYYQRAKQLKLDLGETSVVVCTFTKEALSPTDVRIKYSVNTNTGEITDLSISGSDPDATESTEYSYSLTAIEVSKRSLPTNTDFSINTIGSYKNGNTCRGTCYLKSLKIEQQTQNVSSYGYTVHYNLDGTTVKTISGNAALNSAIPVLPTDAAFSGDGDYSSQKYFIISDEVPVQSVTSNEHDNVLNIPVRVPYSSTLNVIRAFDGVQEVSPFITKELVETDNKVANWVYSFPYYVQKDEKWYKATLKDGKFGEEGTFTSEEVNKTIEYTIDNTVINFWDYSHNNYVDNINYSGGSKNDYQQGQTIGSLEAGKYEVTVMQDNNYSAKLYKDYTDANNQGTELLEFNNSNRTRTLILSDNASGLQIVSTGNSRYDYVLVRKMPNPTVVDLAAANLTYTGSAQNLVTEPTVTGGTIYYSTTSITEGFDTAIPTGINAGDYSVWYKVVGDETHNDIAATLVEGVKINQATNSLSGDLTISGWAYGTTANTPSGVSATFGEVVYKYSNAENGEYGTYDAIVNGAVGTWWVKAFVEGTDNYTAAESGAVSFIISSAATTINVTAQDYSGTYDGAAHGISITAEEGATITYRTTDSGEYNLTEKPTYTDVGTYTVYYKVTKENCEDVTGSKTVTITRAAGSINAFDPASGSVAMETTDFAITTKATGDGTITYSSGDKNIATINATTGAVTPVSAGTTTITATVTDKDGGNYTYAAESNTATYELTVTTSEPVTYTVTKGSESHCEFTVEPVGDNVTEGATITVNVTSVEAGYYVNYIGYEYYDETLSKNRTVKEKEYTERTETITETFAMPALNITVKVGTAKHTHNFSYEIGTGDNSNVLTATCSANGCGLSGKSATLTLTANGGIYSGSAFAATTDLDAFNTATGLSATCSITYTGDNENYTETAPTNVGSYTAKATVTIDGTSYVLTKGFSITEVPVTTYNITVPAAVNGNSITADVSSAAENATVTLTITTASGYSFKSISAKYADNGTVTLEEGSDGTRTFTMPAADVTITATWTISQTDSQDSNTSETYTVTELGGIEVSQVTSTEGATSITISADKVGDVEVTTIADNAFSNITNKEQIKSVDLSATKITNVEVNRSSGVFKDFPEETMIYMPADNTAATGQKNVIIGGNCSDFEMKDGKSYSIPKEFTASQATFKRTFTADQKCTVCLPYSFTATGGTFYEFTGIDNNQVQMTAKTDGSTLSANTPYIFMPNASSESISASSVTVSMSDAPKTENATYKFNFVGTYESKVWNEAPSGIYGFSAEAGYGATAGQFVRVGSGASIAPFRAYLEYTGDEAGKPSTTRTINNLPEVLDIVWIPASGGTTGINGLDHQTADDAPMYNLSGQRVDKSYKGIVIQNGKKMIKK